MKGNTNYIKHPETIVQKTNHKYQQNKPLQGSEVGTYTGKYKLVLQRLSIYLQLESNLP